MKAPISEAALAFLASVRSSRVGGHRGERLQVSFSPVFGIIQTGVLRVQKALVRRPSSVGHLDCGNMVAPWMSEE